jgi:hypothetical protein
MTVTIASKLSRATKKLATGERTNQRLLFASWSGQGIPSAVLGWSTDPTRYRA